MEKSCWDFLLCVYLQLQFIISKFNVNIHNMLNNLTNLNIVLYMFNIKYKKWIMIWLWSTLLFYIKYKDYVYKRKHKIKSTMVEFDSYSLLRINNSYTTDRFTDSCTILSIESHERAISRSETRECGCYCQFVFLCIDCFKRASRQPSFFFISLRRCSVFPSGIKKKVRTQHGNKNVRIDG